MKSNSFISISFISVLFIFSTTNAAQTQPLSPSLSERTKDFVAYMVKKYHFSHDKLVRLLSQAKYDEKVMEKITHPYEQQPWYIYRNHFVTKERINAGVQYWKNHVKELHYAKEHYGIPPSIIVAIIGVETNYGEETGGYSALNALTTLAFYHKTRSEFFKKELTHFLLLGEEQALPITNIKSSYAGALGIPQFMPSTYRTYAVKYPTNKHINLLDNDSDAIVSIANYFQAHGWHKNQPVAMPCNTTPSFASQLISDTALPNKTIQQLKNLGLEPLTPIAEKKKAAVITLQDAVRPEYWLTFHNFRVIMRYNPSIIYAMAVYQLSQTIQHAYVQQTS